MRGGLLLAGAIVAEVMGTLALRASVAHPGWIAVVVLGYAGAFVCLGLALREGMSIGMIYGIWAAAGVAIVAVCGVLLFGEMLSPAAALGIAVIVAGVVLVQTGAHPKQVEA